MPLADSKPVEVTYFPIATAANMMSALQQAWSNISYYGIITMTEDGQLSITLTGPGNARIDAEIGDVLIWNGTSLAVLSNAEFLVQYQPK